LPFGAPKQGVSSSASVQPNSVHSKTFMFVRSKVYFVKLFAIAFAFEAMKDCMVSCLDKKRQANLPAEAKNSQHRVNISTVDTDQGSGKE